MFKFTNLFYCQCKLGRPNSHISQLLRYRLFFKELSYSQGQSFKEGVREYFYYIDHQGQLFLEGTKIRNFVTCFKDKDFLIFFFKRLKTNRTGRYDEFPFVSRCGPELNFIRCENQPIVFTDLHEDENEKFHLIINNIGPEMTVPFEPSKLCMLPKNGRVYHPASEKAGGVGILKTSLAIDFSSYFSFNDENDSEQPTHFHWKGKTYTLDNNLWNILKHENVEDIE